MRRSRLARKPRGAVQTESFELKGGLNLVDAPMTIPPGMVLAATNYELLPRGGYHRVDGFERSDGQARPSEASYWVLPFDAGDIAEPVDNGLVAGNTSGATGKVGTLVLESGSWVGGDAAGYIALYTLSGIFIDNEILLFLGGDPAFNFGFSSGFA
jgi:hypothetical protein